MKDSKIKTRVNQDIKAPEIRLIDSEGNQLGVMKVNEAIRIAQERGQDLIEVSPGSKPPVCKIGNFGKFKYEKQKRDKEQKKSKGSQLKEIRFHPNTDTHDLEFKCRHLKEFLIQGHKVKATVIFIGRMMVHQDIGRRLMDNVIEKLSPYSKIDQPPKMEGRNMTVLLIPDKKKIDQYNRELNKQNKTAEPGDNKEDNKDAKNEK